MTAAITKAPAVPAGRERQRQHTIDWLRTLTAPKRHEPGEEPRATGFYWLRYASPELDTAPCRWDGKRWRNPNGAPIAARHVLEVLSDQLKPPPSTHHQAISAETRLALQEVAIVGETVVDNPWWGLGVYQRVRRGLVPVRAEPDIDEVMGLGRDG